MGTGCSEEQAQDVKVVAEGQPVKVITLLAAQADFAKEIGKDKVQATSLLPQGENFWQWAPILKEQKDIQESDLFIINGANIEERWFKLTKEAVLLKNKDLLIVDPSTGIDRLPLLRFLNVDASPEEQKRERQDPWFYLDPQLAKQEVDTILAALVKKAPAYADEFKKNAEAYKSKLDALDKTYADTLAKTKHKVLVSPYPAFQYLSKRYGLTYYVPNYLMYNDYPMDPAEHGKVKEDLAKHATKSIYFEQEAAPRVQEFLGMLGYKSRILDPYEGKQPTEGYKSYLHVMEQNLQVLAEGLNE